MKGRMSFLSVPADCYGGCEDEVPEMDVAEWLALLDHDYDEVDRLIIDLETIGGG